jgi:hypothetical protein
VSARFDPDDPDYDVTLGDELMKMSPLERIRENDRVLRLIAELRDGISCETAVIWRWRVFEETTRRF